MGPVNLLAALPQLLPSLISVAFTYPGQPVSVWGWLGSGGPFSWGCRLANAHCHLSLVHEDALAQDIFRMVMECAVVVGVGVYLHSAIAQVRRIGWNEYYRILVPSLPSLSRLPASRRKRER